MSSSVWRACGLAAAAALTLAPPVSTQRQPPARRIELVAGRAAVAGEVIVRYRPGARAADRASALDLESDAPVGAGLRRVRARRGSTADLMASLSARPDVAFVEPNYLVRAAGLPNDPLFSKELGLRNPSMPGADAHAAGAWDVTTGSRANVVALIDSGTDYRHPDLVGSMWTAPAAFTVTINGVQVTCPAGTHGFNVIAMTCDPMDDNGHGTAMAGVIGAAGNNGIGVTGINWTASIMPIKFLGADGWGSYADALNAMDFALQVKDAFAAQGNAANVRVMSNSWSGDSFSQALLDGVNRVVVRNVLFVAAAGNDATNDDERPKYPASFDHAGIISVAATTDRDTLQPYSNYGLANVDLGAPATTHSTALAGKYADTGGTSAATALVSGAALLTLSQCNLTAAQLRDTILSNVDVIAALSGITVTGGRLNAERAVDDCRGGNRAPAVGLTSPLPGQHFDPPATMTLTADALDSDGTVANVAFFAGTTMIARDSSAPFTVAWSQVPAGTYSLTAVATDNDGATASSAAITVTVDLPVVSLPTPWLTRDIGSTGIEGWASESAGTFTVEGAGADVWGTADQFRYVYRPLTGDGEIVARVALVENIDVWSKAGVMIRDTVAPGSPHAFMLVSPGKGLAFQRRKALGGTSTSTAGGAGVAPYWLKLRRAGQTITASASADGTSWRVIGSDTFSMGTTVLAGVVVSSHRTGTLATALFDSVSVSTGSTAALPTGWAHVDVGLTGVPGAALAESGVFTIKGAGADVWGVADAFHFAYTTLSGDGQMVAKVATEEAVNAWTKAGLMVRASLAADAAHGFMLVSPGKGLAFQRRSAAGSLSENTAGGTGMAPMWVKLTRTGQTLVAFRSSDGVTWTEVGRDTIALPATAYVGLAVSSHVVGRTATATFDHVMVGGGQ